MCACLEYLLSLCNFDDAKPDVFRRWPSRGIFRTNRENGQQEAVRKQLNIGYVPHGVDVDFLVGFIKGLAWSMPTSGALDRVAEKLNLPFFEELCQFVGKKVSGQ
nr:hypothetical protein [Tanacetum cinerariifolium]